jgi:DNA ligase-associated metallophosphoesterase
MTGFDFTFCGAALTALPSGALWWEEARLLTVADLHLGKSERLARRGGALLPPYETAETLARLAEDVARLRPAIVVCLGDSFDDLEAEGALTEAEAADLNRLMAGRRWIWIEGNHDPGPLEIGGDHLGELRHGPLTFRHIAAPGATGEVSGHYHPKARLNARGRSVSRRCFLTDARRVILPAFGTYTGGLDARSEPLAALFPTGQALMLGLRVVPTPLAVL